MADLAVLAAANADHDFDTRGFHAVRQGWQAAEGDIVGFDVPKGATFDIVKVMVHGACGIVDGAIRVEVNLPHQAAIGQRLECVVNRCFGNFGAGMAQSRDDLVRRQMGGLG